MLPGGFELPVSIVKEQWIFREVSDCALDAKALEAGLESYSKGYLAGRMISGRVLTESHSLQKTTGAVFLQSKYTCLEMIGRTQNEEILK